MKTLLLLLTLIFCNIYSQNPPGIEWKKIETEHVELIFDSAIESQAQKLAGVIEIYYYAVGKHLAPLPNKLSIVLANNTANANGYVMPMPLHSAFFTTPQMDGYDYSMNWLEQLAAHELRHVSQVTRTISGVSMLFYYLFGEVGGYVMPRFAIPIWYNEGEAVMYETLLSETGRGHLPSFTMETRAKLLSGVNHSLTKEYLGSYKDLTTGPYKMGYLLNVYIVKKYGIDVWDKVISVLWATGAKLKTFSGALKHVTGFTADQLYQKMLLDFKQYSEAQLMNTTLTPNTVISTSPKTTFTNYTNPVFRNGSVYAFKHGLASRPSLVKLEEDGEVTIFEKGRMPSLSMSDSLVTWSSHINDIRYSMQSYSDIFIYDFTSKKTRQLTRNQRYYTPDINPQGSAIVSARYTTSMQSSIEMLDIQTGEVIKKISADSNSIFRAPKWSADGIFVVFTSFDNATNTSSILRWDPCMSVVDTLITTKKTISNPTITKEYILYNSPQSGIDNIYAVHAETKQIYQVTSSKFGAFNPAIDTAAKTIAYQDYTVDGFNIVTIPFDPDTWIPAEQLPKPAPYYHEALTAYFPVDSVIRIPSTATNPQPVENYSSMENMINIHSWLPDFCTASILGGCDNLAGIQLYSTNILRDFNISGYGYYNTNEKNISAGVEAQFIKYFPILSTSFEYNPRSYIVPSSDTLHPDTTYNYKTINSSFDLAIPLLFSKNGLFHSLFFGASWSYRYSWDYNDNRQHSTQSYQPITYNAQWSIGKLRAHRDLASPLSQSLSLSYTHTPLNTVRHEQTFVRSNTNVPGLFKHHNTRVTLSHEYQFMQGHGIQSLSAFTKGYTPRVYENFTNAIISYNFPIAYLDKSLTRALYITRIRGGLFYNYSLVNHYGMQDHLQSYGITLDFDAHWFRLFPEFPIGIRYSIVPETNDKVINIRVSNIDF